MGVIMNKRFTLLGILFASLISCEFIKAAIKPLTAKPVVFIDFAEAFWPRDSKKVAKSLEWIDLQKREQKLRQIALSGDNGIREEKESIYNAQQNLQKKLMDVAFETAKHRGACAVLEIYLMGPNICVDPAYNITNEAVEQLNKEYLAAK